MAAYIHIQNPIISSSLHTEQNTADRCQRDDMVPNTAGCQPLLSHVYRPSLQNSSVQASYLIHRWKEAIRLKAPFYACRSLSISQESFPNLSSLNSWGALKTHPSPMSTVFIPLLAPAAPQRLLSPRDPYHMLSILTLTIPFTIFWGWRWGTELEPLFSQIVTGVPDSQMKYTPPPKELCLSLTQLVHFLKNVLTLHLDNSVLTTCSFFFF